VSGIVYGVCGIGNGHAYRQMPVVRALALRHRVVVLAYGDSLETYGRLAARDGNLRVVPVTVPYLPGRRGGIDWAAVADGARPGGDYWRSTGAALAEVERLVGTPDLVVSDYEPVSAMCAYATGAPLVTLDQQSKFLVGDLPVPGGGAPGCPGPEDEVARLRLFFPCARLRLACSFFPVPRLAEPHAEVTVIPPVLRAEMLRLERRPSARPSVLVYLSGQHLSRPDLPGLYAALGGRPDVDFHLFGRAARGDGAPAPPVNVRVHAPDDAVFLDLLGGVHGLVCTAGHNLLSEAVHLRLPVLAMPLGIHEQRLNAAMVAAAGAGMSSPVLTAPVLAEFLDRLPELRRGMEAGNGLVRGVGADEVLRRLERWLPS